MLSVPVKQRTPAQTAPRFSRATDEICGAGRAVLQLAVLLAVGRGISFAVQAQPEMTIASLQTRVVLQALACVTLPYHRTSALELAHSTGCRIRADWCILRAPAMLPGAEAGVGAAGGECFVTDRCRELA